MTLPHTYRSHRPRANVVGHGGGFASTMGRPPAVPGRPDARQAGEPRSVGRGLVPRRGRIAAGRKAPPYEDHVNRSALSVYAGQHGQDPLHPGDPSPAREGRPLHRAPVSLRGARRDAGLLPRARGGRARGGEDLGDGGRRGRAAHRAHARRPRGVDQGARPSDRAPFRPDMQAGGREPPQRLPGGRHEPLRYPKADAGLGRGERRRAPPHVRERGIAWLPGGARPHGSDPRPRPHAGGRGHHALTASADDGERGSMGIRRKKVVPLPVSVSKPREPWCLATIDLAMARPCPVPPPTSLVVKKGSNTLSRMASGIPVPVSEMATTASSPSRRVVTRILPRLPVPLTASPMAWAALITMFNTTWFRSPAWHVMGGRSPKVGSTSATYLYSFRAISSVACMERLRSVATISFRSGWANSFMARTMVATRSTPWSVLWIAPGTSSRR